MIVYWIHYKEHLDPYTEGYIGITNNLERRIDEHKSKHSKSRHVKNRIGAGAIFSVIHQVDTIQEAASLEEKYRPTENIGWNICKGGGYPPSQTGGLHLDTNRLKGDDRTKQQKLSAKNHSERMIGKIPWNKDKTGLQEAWNKGKKHEGGHKQAQIERTCPQCKKSGRGNGMLRWHFDNCRVGGF